MIEVRNICKHYGPTVALDGVSFSVSKGEIVGLLGPNGAGKTTTMRILTGFTPPSQGQAIVAGLDVTTDGFRVKEKVGYLPEVPPLYPELSVQGYLKFIAELRRVPSKQKQKKVNVAMEQTALTSVCNRLVGNLSRGYKQRVALAGALVHEPEVLILDEPTIGLDPIQIIEIRNLIRSLAGGRTIILSSHILQEISATCQRVIIINKGTVVAMGTEAELSNRMGRGGELQVRVSGDRDAVAAAIRAMPGVEGVVPAANTLEEIFLKLMGDA